MHAGTCPNSHRRANMDASPDMDTITRADVDTSRSGARGDGYHRICADTNGDTDQRSDAYRCTHTGNYGYPYYNRDSHYHANTDSNRIPDRHRSSHGCTNAHYHSYSNRNRYADNHAHSRIHANTDTCNNRSLSYSYNNRHANIHTYSSLCAHTDSVTNRWHPSHGCTNADNNSYANWHRYSYLHTLSYNHGNTDGVTDQYHASHDCTYADDHSYSNCNRYSYLHTLSYSHGNADTGIYTYHHAASGRLPARPRSADRTVQRYQRRPVGQQRKLAQRQTTTPMVRNHHHFPRARS